MKVIVVGAGAAGCFAAIEMKRRNPMLQVTVLEGGRRPLAKVLVTGGGRCNLTNSFRQVTSLERIYPRGHRLMKRLFHEFGPQDTYQWWEDNGVALVTQDDECVFPRSQQAQEIADTLLRLMRQLKVEVRCSQRVRSITPLDDGGGYELLTQSGETYRAQAVLLTMGGVQSAANLEMLQQCPLKTEMPLPSLYSFKLPQNPITQLMGLVQTDAVASIAGTKFRAQGPLLITHWGMSGPAVLKLSSYAARWLAEQHYKCTLAVNWMQGEDEQTVRRKLEEIKRANEKKMLPSVHPSHLQGRLWEHLLQQAGIDLKLRWIDLNQKLMNKLVNTLINSQYSVDGKNPFKEEFVTCGGVSLSEINQQTMEHKTHKGLYFAGEVLDVDAVTGGFNLQAAWTMGYVAAKTIAERECL